MDNRERLPEGFQLYCHSRVYTIEKYISAGSNSIVYQAGYEDSLMPEHIHSVLIKELYPLDPKGGIIREISGKLYVPPEAMPVFQYHKKSFLLGNEAHLSLSDAGRGFVAENLDSFEANGTLYTVLTARKGEVLSQMMESGRKFPDLTSVILCIRSLLRALAPFHTHGLLHLDVSPDNIFLLMPETENAFPEDVLLLDFNSVYSPGAELDNECLYYLGKKNYMAPEVTLHQKEELGPWTDLYSVSAVFYEILTGEKLPDDRELMKLSGLFSSFSPLLLHEKENTAQLVNEILKKGLQILPQNRYRNTDEMLEDLQKVLDNLNGVTRMHDVKQPAPPVENKKITVRRSRKKTALYIGALILLFAVAGFILASVKGKEQMEESPVSNLAEPPLELDASVELWQKNTQCPLEDNILEMQADSSTQIQINLKDYIHKSGKDDVFETYLIYSIFNGRDDKRGWQNGEQFYDFFYTPDNTLHMVLPFQDTNSFDLEYVGVIFANFNYTDTSVLLDITKCTLTDGAGNGYELTDLYGSHVIFFDEEEWQWNLLTMQNQEVVKDFQEIYGGKLEVDVSACFLDPVLEVEWESSRPEIAEVDEKGKIQAFQAGTTILTVTVKDKNTNEKRSTQMLVHVSEVL